MVACILYNISINTMDGRSELIIASDSVNACSIAVSEANSHVYITSEHGLLVYSQTGQHLYTLIHDHYCFGICIYENYVFVSCNIKHTTGSIQIFTIDGDFITTILGFKLKNRTHLITSPFGIHIDVAGGELSLFVCLPYSERIVCSTHYKNFVVCNQRLDRPRDIKSNSHNLFIILGKTYTPILLVDKLDISSIQSVIHPGLGPIVPSSIGVHGWPLISSNINFISIHPQREELYIFKSLEGSLYIYNLVGTLLDIIHIDFLPAKTTSFQQGFVTDKHDVVYVLVETSVIRINL